MEFVYSTLLISKYYVVQKEPPSPQASPTGSSSYTDSNMNDSNKNNYNSKRSGESEFKSFDNTTSTFASRNATQDTNNSHASARSGNNNNNNNGDSTPTSSTNRNSSANGNNTTSNASNTGITEDNQYINPSFSSSPSHLNPVQYVAVMAENEELKNELEALTKQLENAKIQKEEQQKEVVRLVMQILLPL